jgi:hypothetical protein
MVTRLADIEKKYYEKNSEFIHISTEQDRKYRELSTHAENLE